MSRNIDVDTRLGQRVFTRGEIETRVREIAIAIAEDYRDRRPILIGILRGAVYFTVDITRQLAIPFDLDFMSLSNFKMGLQKAEIEKDLNEPVYNRHVIIVEDIVDTGLTLNFLIKVIESRRPASIKTCAFLDCRERRIADVPIDYACFQIPDVFVVGYGLDFRGNFRNLYDVFTLHDPSGRNTQILKQTGKRNQP
ncbi:MAG TPA: hypoxanthine phosphoribosyltransferase [Atribacteraceae bacterium]|nr:hypoxanthine phosphoribosyltransferase [Atribacteraceae bacterium]